MTQSLVMWTVVAAAVTVLLPVALPGAPTPRKTGVSVADTTAVSGMV